MSSKNGEVYIISDDDNGEWVNPMPVSTAVVEAVTEATGLDADDLDDLDAYVDRAALREVLATADGTLTFEVEGHEVTVDADGTIDVET